MAAPANSLRLGLRIARNAAARAPIIASRPFLARRALSSTVPRRNDEEPTAFDEYIEELATQRRLKPEEREEIRKQFSTPPDVPKDIEKQYAEFLEEFDSIDSDVTTGFEKVIEPRRDTFWHEGEEDPDMITDEVGEDDFEEDDMMSLAHPKLEEHREYREYARIAVWEMPLLAQFAKPFEPPAKEQVLRFRYTSYLGEIHPADRKVVVEFAPKDLTDLTSAQQLKLMKLAGARYNPSTEIIKISCERFEHQAQNKRYLGDLVNKMIETAKDPTDMFEDIPLDTRHHKQKIVHRFPKEWILTEERKAQLAAIRQQAYQLDKAKRETGTLVDGLETVKQLVKPAEAAEPVMVRRGKGPMRIR
ncbi:mitochondrial ribosomal subunit protein-domain-containing protein [Echria macrotheca]|uniref:Mitochondrial ribosomal subunit protein-domain-containing protein n=1 Tax=Echria macrotheca TaxID=438768 RepID=A0AAJ0B7K6_9PEZI|nr:mitochondrial ribosomal subunit protein-domain-containing protein [Echria macrotheca]